MKVLFVEDEKDILELYVDVIQITYPDIEIKTAENGREALDICRVNNFDIIFTDINMPVMNGLDFLNKIKEKNSYKVIITGYLDNQDNQGYCYEILMKPISSDSITNIIDKFYD